MSYVLDLRVKKSPKFGRQLVLRLSLPELKRRLNWMLVVMMLMTIAAPIFDALWTGARYDLRGSSALLGNSSPRLAAKFSFDDQKQLYQFNKEGLKTGSEPSTGVGDSSLYSADLPVDSGKGIKLYDNVNNLSFSFVPQFSTLDGKRTDNRLVYPLNASTPQLIYTAQSGGLKEDLIIPHPGGDTQTFRYRLNLGTDLQARMDGAGVGIYSANPTLFGNISFGSEADRQTVEAARRNGKKDYLAFYIPAPTIRQSGKSQASPAAKFALDGDILTVTATGLSKASYPLSIDPSLIVTSSTDFTLGNNEGGVDFSTSGQIGRSGLSGGSPVSFAPAAASPQAETGRNGAGTAIYNNCLYVISGSNATGSYTTSAEYTTIGSGGALGTWNTTSTTQKPHVGGSAFAYNGYLYVLEGDTGNNGNSTVEYAKINTTNCSLSTNWTLVTSQFLGGPNGDIGLILNPGVTVYNDYVYIAGGYNGLVGTVYLQQTWYNKIDADGNIRSAWTKTTDMPEARYGHIAAAYSNYLYIAGGSVGGLGGGPSATVKYAAIKSNGTVGSWATATNSMPNTRQNFAGGIYNGYFYVSGGNNGNASSEVQFASINTDGSVSPWQSGPSLATNRTGHTDQFYGDSTGNYFYTIGGNNGSNGLNSVEQAKLDVVGSLTDRTWGTSTTTTVGQSYGRCAVIYNGYLYSMGGTGVASLTRTDVEKAQLNSDGTTGNWVAVTGMNTGRAYLGCGAYNGALYAVGGCLTTSSINCVTYTNSVEYGLLNQDGTVSSWTTSAGNTMPQNRAAVGFTIYNGYIYVSGGGDGINIYTDILYSKIATNHDYSGWTSGPSITGLSPYNAAAAWNGYLYISGGNSNSPVPTIWYFSLNASTGAPTSLGATTSMINGHYNHGFAAIKGYLYAWGNADNTQSNHQAEFARIKSDGTLTGWTTTQAMTNTGNSAWFAKAADNNGLHVINTTGTTQYQILNNGGSGAPGSWGSGSAITARGEHSAVVLNGYLYIMGGCTSRNVGGGSCKGLTNNIQYSSINSDGSLAGWSNTTQPLPSNLDDFSAFASNGNIYVLGGCTTVNTLTGGCTNGTTAINFVAPAGNGDITTTWTGSGNMPGSSNVAAAVPSAGYVYLFGANGTTNGTTYYGQINTSTNQFCTGATGYICNWTTTSSLNTPRTQLSGGFYNGYVYAVGGTDSGSNPANSIEYAKINSDHTLGSWTKQTTPWMGRQNPIVTAYDGYLCLSAGYAVAPGFRQDTWCGTVLANGSVESWHAGAAVSQGLASPAGAIYNGRIYITGGETGSGANDVQSTVYIGTLQSIPRVARYSKLLDTDLDTTPTKLLLNGSLSNSFSSLSTNYAYAPNSTATFGATSSLSPSFGTPAALTSSSVRYYFLTLSIDDSNAAVFPDAGTAATAVTDLNVYYHANPSRRLRGGKTFTGNSLQSLDASP